MGARRDAPNLGIFLPVSIEIFNVVVLQLSLLAFLSFDLEMKQGKSHC